MLCNIRRKECILFIIMQIKACLYLGDFVWGFVLVLFFKLGSFSAHSFLDGNNTSTINFKGLWGTFSMGKNYHPPILKINHMDKFT